MMLVLIAAGCGGQPEARPGGPHRVVLIVIDTLRADHLEVYGYPKSTAPHLARLADAGVVFERAHSTSTWTAPATSSLMTGLYPNRHGVVEGFFAHRQRESQGTATQPLLRLPDEIPLIAERFAAAGYRTFGVANNINIGPVLGFDRGFEEFVADRKKSTEQLLTAVVEWPALEPGHADRSFLYLHLNDVHSPYVRQAPWFDKPAARAGTAIAAYDSEISYIDHHLERLSERLAWDEDTLVVVVSDHGEEFGDHGGRLHGGGLHEELTHVVMIFSGAGLSPRRVGVDVSLVDVLPTLLELCGIEESSPGLDGPDGRSLVPVMRSGDESRLKDRALLVHRAKMGRNHGGHWWAVIQDGWKLIVEDGTPALFDHRTDRSEQRDLAADEPGRVKTLLDRLDTLRAGTPPGQAARTQIELDDTMRAELEELGYVELDDTPEVAPASDFHPDTDARSDVD